MIIDYRVNVFKIRFYYLGEDLFGYGDRERKVLEVNIVDVYISFFYG